MIFVFLTHLEIMFQTHRYVHNPRLTTSEHYVHPMEGETSAIPMDMSCQMAVCPQKTVSSLYASLKYMYEDKG